ncbi:hypothetical protein NIES4071_29540 [Calothrix sp. NIES-4071]|nr:hypothetical protein NIES4071_29540 [Calothrix sp. NIES-4071]BAZ57274.1 hypothetical protein NIES4105_29480 [Calothrix sp. NIES-4105]
MNEDPRIRNQLFEIERALKQKRQKNQSKSDNTPNTTDKTPDVSKVQAMAFDFDEAISLHYNGYTYGASFDYNEEQPDSANADSKHVAFEQGASEQGAEPVSFEVESFGADNYNYYPPSNDSIPAIPVTESTPIIPLKSAHPMDVASVSTASAFDEDEDAQAFTADLQAILKGEKTYEPETKQLQPAEQHNTPLTSPTQAPPDANQMSKATSHNIFDQVAENMNFANSFELGTLALEQRFDEFDRLLDRENNPQLKPAVPPEVAYASSVTNNWVAPEDIPPPLAYAKAYSDDEWTDSLALNDTPADSPFTNEN